MLKWINQGSEVSRNLKLGTIRYALVKLLTLLRVHRQLSDALTKVMWDLEDPLAATKTISSRMVNDTRISRLKTLS